MEENECVVKIHKTVSKHPVALVFAYVNNHDVDEGIEVFKKVKMPLPVYELRAEGPFDPCLEEVPDFDYTPTFYVYKDGVKVGKVKIEKGKEDQAAEELKKLIEQGSKYKYSPAK
mgnify:CR=1 FL=1